MDQIAPPKPGIYYDVPYYEYERWDAFHSSMLKPMKRSLKYYNAVKDKPYTSDSLDFGSLVDTLLFEAQNFDRYFQKLPPTYKNSKGKNAAFTKKSPTCRGVIEEIRKNNKIPYIDSDVQKAKMLIDNIKRHREASEMLHQAKHQVSLVWEHPSFGIICKGRPDLLCAPHYMADLKTSCDATPGKYAIDINKFGYHIQAAFYLEGYFFLTGKEPGYRLIVAETEVAYDVRTIKLAPESVNDNDNVTEWIEVGKQVYSRLLNKYIKAKKYNVWPGYSEFLETERMPRFAVSQEEAAPDECWLMEDSERVGINA